MLFYIILWKRENSLGRKIHFTIPEKYDGEKVKTYLRQEKHVSARLLHTLKVMPTGILCNNHPIRAIDSIHTNDCLSIELPEEAPEQSAKPLDIPLSILYEDEDILVINKPGNIAMHETHNHQGDALSNAVSNYLQKQGKSAAFRSVGRLDKGTSGVVVCALHAYAASILSGQIQKEYLAVVPAKLEGSGTINRCIYRPDPNKTLRAVGDTGETAITHWTALHTTPKGNTLLRIQLETGRTHQIRVHFSSLGLSLLGDDMYGAPKDSRIHRQALHCAVCRLSHPISGKPMTFYAPVPQDFSSLLWE